MRLKVARAVWSGTGTSSTRLVANSFRGKVDLTLTVTSRRVRPCSWISATALKGSVMPSAAVQQRYSAAVQEQQ